MYDAFTQRTMEFVQEACRKMPEVELRDLFAMQALNFFCENGNWRTVFFKDGKTEELNNISVSCYKIADAMMKARKVKDGK